MPDNSKPPLPIEAVAAYPYPGYTAPGSFAFSPDDTILTYLYAPDASLTRQLYRFDPTTGAAAPLVHAGDLGGATVDDETLSLEAQLRRERQRELARGITGYAWADEGQRILLPLDDAIYILDRPDLPPRLLVDAGDGGPLLDPQFAPGGNWVAYVQDAELYVVPTAGAEPRQLTHGARGTGKTHGLAEYVAQEEMERRHGYWWSPDARLLAFTAVDETHIPVYRIMHQGKDEVGPAAHEDHRYPFAGAANARVRLGVIPREGGTPVWMDLGRDNDIYLARVRWLPDGALTAQVVNRAQSELRLLRFDPSTGAAMLLVRETSNVWINLHDMFRPLSQKQHAGAFIWASERSGYRHLYLYDRGGRLRNAITSGEWVVSSIAGIDEEDGVVYVVGTYDDPRQRHLYAVPFAGGPPQRLTPEAGTHNVLLDHACRRFVDVHDSPAQPPRVTLRALDAGAAVLQTIYDDTDPRIATLQLEPPELVTLDNRHGDTLYGVLYRPPAAYGSGPHPTLISVYGGPHVQRVLDSWSLTVNMFAQYLRRQGFLVFALDNRGSANRGLSFEGHIRHDMGHVEVEDQVDGVRWLVDQGLADPARVGIYGASYGGYMSLMCLLRAPEIFHAASVTAPVTHWDGYDTFYTERYMGAPSENPAGYTASSPVTYVDQMRGDLLLVHGLIDENVHFRHTARLINALIRARRPYDLLLFPDERHMPRRLEDRVFMYERIAAFFQKKLPGPTPVTP